MMFGDSGEFTQRHDRLPKPQNTSNLGPDLPCSCALVGTAVNLKTPCWQFPYVGIPLLQVVNCLEPHPSSTVLATSGLESTVKIWAPPPATHLGLPRDWSAVVRANARPSRHPSLIVWISQDFST